MATNNIFNNLRDWKTMILITGVVAGAVVLGSLMLDSSMDQQVLAECVGRNISLGAVEDIAIRLCAIQLER